MYQCAQTLKPFLGLKSFLSDLIFVLSVMNYNQVSIHFRLFLALNEVADLTIIGISITIAAVAFAIMKTPLIRNILKSRKVFMVLTIISVLAICKC